MSSTTTTARASKRATTTTDTADSAAIAKHRQRAGLPQRHNPYWLSVRPNCFVGFRVRKGKPGTWFARMKYREVDPATKKAREVDRREPLGKLDHLDEPDRYTTALTLAVAWFGEVQASGIGAHVLPTRVTLRDAMAQHVRAIEKMPNVAARKARDTQLQLDRWCSAYLNADGTTPELWLDRPVVKITAEEWEEWRAWVTAAPLVHDSKRTRKPASVSRIVITMRAALNRAAEAYGLSPVWKAALATVREHDERRGSWAYMDLAQRGQLLAACREVAPSVVAFVRLLLVMPVRPGAMARVKVGDYDARFHTLAIPAEKKTPARVLTLPTPEEMPELHALMAELTKGRAAGEPLLVSFTGKQWTRHQWNAELKKAVERAGLDSKISMYCLRHCRITDLVEAGKDYGTIGKIAGTSARMIEKHYHHLRAQVVRSALMVPGV